MVIYRLSFTDYVIKYSEERETVFLHYICEEMREKEWESRRKTEKKGIECICEESEIENASK